MKKKDLLELLEGIDDEDEIVIAVQAHDHWRTILAMQAYATYEGEVRHSGYHDQDVIINEEETGDFNAPSRPVIVLNLQSVAGKGWQ